MRVALCWFSHSENRRSVTPPGSEDDHKGSWRLGAALWQLGGSTTQFGLVRTWTASLLSFRQRTFQTWPASHHAPPKLSLNTTLRAIDKRVSNAFPTPLALPTRISQRVDCDRLIFRRFSTCRDNAGGTGSSIAPLGGLRPGKKWRNLPSAKPSTDTRATLHPSRPPVLSISRLFFSACHFRRLRFLHHSRDNRDFSPSPDSHRSLDFFRVPFPVLIVINQPHASSRQPPSWRTSTSRRRRRPSR